MRDVEFILTGDYIELNHLLKLVGACDSGGAGKRRVAAGDVSVDGKVELRKTCKIRAGQVVHVDALRVRVMSPARSGSAEQKKASSHNRDQSFSSGGG